jgi:quinol monooxygenase YgiN
MHDSYVRYLTVHTVCTRYQSKSIQIFQVQRSIFQQRRPYSNSPVAMANMIMTTTRITVSSANRCELFQTILTLLVPIMNEKGCRSSRFYLDSADNNSGMLVEEWDTREDWDNHLQSRDCAVFLGAVRVLCRPTSVDFKLLSYVAGIEAVTSARKVHSTDY